MKRFKHILAPTDLSSESFSAVQYAAHLAQAQTARLTIVHVSQATTLLFTDFSPPIDLLALDKEIEAAAREKLEGWVARHIKGDVAVKVLIKSGVTHDVITKVAEDIGASLIVMATHGRRGLGHALLGSVTERVLREAPCPVLVVRPPAADEKATRKKRR
ncbi:MAG TPA: universal stress protein [Candidatus Limnocylindrales bacterium]|nr:universal stress protein [Candidatus Limnocylindrales bacterium]